MTDTPRIPHDEVVFRALRYLGAQRGLDASTVRRALTAAPRRTETSDHPDHLLMHSARLLDLDLHEEEVTAQTLLTPPSGGWVVWSPSQGAYVAVEQQRGRKVRVVILRGRRRDARWVTAPHLASLAGLAQGARTVTVFRPRPTHPLRALRQGRHDRFTPWRRLWGWLSLERRDATVLLAYAVASGLFSLAVPLTVQALFNTVAFSTLLQPLLVLALILTAALGVYALFSALQSLVVEYLGRRIFVRTALDFAHRLPAINLRRLGGRDLSTMTNQFMDVAIADKATASILLDGLAAALQVLVGLTLLAAYHPFLLAFDAVLVAAMLVVTFALGRKAVRTAIYESKSKYAMMAWLQEVAASPALFASPRGDGLLHETTEDLAAAWVTARERHFRIHFRQVVATLVVQVLAMAGLLLVGGALVMHRQLTLGQLVAAEVMIALTVRSLARLVKQYGKLYDLLAAWDKIGAVIDLEEQPRAGEPIPVRMAGLTLEAHVNDSSWRVPAGAFHIVPAWQDATRELVGLLNAPKATTRGQLFLDGIDATNLSLQALHEQVMVLSPQHLYTGSLRDNLTLGDLRITTEQVRATLSEVGLLGQLDELDEGLETCVDRRGEPLSHSQRAALLLTRALLLQPRLLVLDCVLDTLSPAERAAWEQRLRHPARQWTVICASQLPAAQWIPQDLTPSPAANAAADGETLDAGRRYAHTC